MTLMIGVPGKEMSLMEENSIATAILVFVNINNSLNCILRPSHYCMRH